MLRLVGLLMAVAFCTASDVLELGDSDFDSTLGEHDLVLVKFYAPWCGHCKKLAPEFDRAAAALLNNDPPVHLAKVDCTAEGKETCSKFSVSGFPTLKAFKRGEVAFDYNGPREADGIVKYMKSKAGPSSKELKSADDVEKFIGGDDQAIVGFFEKADSELALQFQKLADALSEDFKFGHTADTGAIGKYEHKDDVVIFHPKRLHNKFEGNNLVFDGEPNMPRLKQWLNDNVNGLCGHRTTGNQAQFKKPLFVAFYDVDYAKNTKGTNYWRNRVLKVAKKFADANKNTYFAISNKDDFNHELSEYNVTPSGDKPVVAARDSSDMKYVMKDEFSVDNLEQFVNDVLDGKLKPYLKSEPIPESNDEPVKVVVAEQFNEIVNNKDKDVLIEFYAPWCGHCKSLSPKYDELATMFADEEDIVITKMDATANDVPAPYEVRGFPTLYFAPKNSKDAPRKYEAGREVDDFVKYLAKESTNELKGWGRNGKKLEKTEL